MESGGNHVKISDHWSFLAMVPSDTQMSLQEKKHLMLVWAVAVSGGGICGCGGDGGGGGGGPPVCGVAVMVAWQ